eukprot:9439561-Pyramimonas_sp.AAC.1
MAPAAAACLQTSTSANGTYCPAAPGEYQVGSPKDAHSRSFKGSSSGGWYFLRSCGLKACGSKQALRCAA